MDYSIPKQKVYVVIHTELELFSGYLYTDTGQRLSDYINDVDLTFIPVEVNSICGHNGIPFMRLVNKNHITFIKEEVKDD